ncbi:unnamed protein product [Rhizophagus irregularis]|uniref:Uncharacterized protein n=1 Tax=Rhizophagus irregularis TaxID=588596 RepID=A0A2I1HMH1_9GLOM|nr:hypothetical protein RhiirA4_483362 [Rhizophagus irregularis]CAB4418099.1 unnamed protein product [Rhizophagus irregularis]
MKGHEKRFLKNGTYESILKVAKQWAIIDIRNNKKGALIKKRAVDVIYVSCAEDFEFVDLKYPDGTKERVKLVHMKEVLLGFHISDFQSKFQDKFQDQMDIDEY